MTTPSFSFGPDYPAVLTDFDGTLMPQVREGRFWRTFRHPSTGAMFLIPRFMDGSAGMTLEQLRAEWPSMSATHRSGFCGAVRWLNAQADYPDMVRYVVREGTTELWPTIATAVAQALPQDEAFQVLCEMLAATDVGRRANVVQAIAMTKHHLAPGVVRTRFDEIWAAPTLWDGVDEPGTNHLAHDATHAIRHLLELGTPPSDLEPAVRRLAGHPCHKAREACRGVLKAWYPWLAADGPA
jgi:hypothetical protein